MAPLETKLLAALQSREERQIRRRLSDPKSDSGLIDFHTNDYLSLSTSQDLRDRFLAKLQTSPNILGSGGSRLLVNGEAHSSLEARLAKFFNAPTALLFNSGFDANVGFFSCIPQPGDVVVYDEYIHASVHDGIRSSRVKSSTYSFEHNSLNALGALLVQLIKDRPELCQGKQSLFIAVESLYSMDGTIAPLTQIVEMVETLFPKGNGYVVVDEAHATGIYGPQGKGLVALLGLERRVLARLCTFGKALAGSGAVVLTTEVIRDYMLNYARSLIYTTSLSYANIISVDCSFDLLENGTAKKLASRLLEHSTYFVFALRDLLHLHSIPLHILSLPTHLQYSTGSSSSPSSSSSLTTPPLSLTPSLSTLPSPIIPLLTSSPRPLSHFLRITKHMNARPITWPTVPKGKERVRVCLHAGNTREEVEGLVSGVVEWALREVEKEKGGRGRVEVRRGGGSESLPVQSKL
ncbi:PLP-dependent transferase [Panus rudis PR-1116 ss-1]|nr:PLP-dependent transferase [Panus rudis PR-1116 ss-1]